MGSSLNGRAEHLRELLAAPGPLELPGCYDVLSAMVIDQVGFSACFLSGYGVAASVCGNPDIGLTTLTETASMARNVAGTLRIPLVVDADNGYGNEENVTRAIGELEHAGAAGIVIEDQVFPKRCGHAANKAVIPQDEFLRKLDRALNGRRTPLVVIARTDSTDLDDAIRRATAFHAAGADATIVDGLTSIEALRRVGREVPGLKQINLIYGGRTPLLSAAELHALGFKIVLYSTPALYAVMTTLQRSMRQLKETGNLDSLSAESTSFPVFQDFIETRYIERVAAKPNTKPDGDGSGS